MTKYAWHQRYGIDRFDLEESGGKLIGWIVGTPDKSVTNFITRSLFGYITSYSVEANSKEEISWTWKIWWAERDEKGYYKSESLTDGKAYSKMDEAKASLQERFGVRSEEVSTVKWNRNFTEYN